VGTVILGSISLPGARRHALSFFLALVLALFCYAATGYGPGIRQAFAATCSSAPSHANCSNKDPVQQGCAPSAQTVASQNWPSAGAQTEIYLDTRWKSACKSNWSRLWTSPATSDCGYTYIASDAYPYTNDDPYGYEYYAYNGPCYSATIWSPMLYAPTWHAQACGYFAVNDQQWMCNWPM